MSTTIDSSLSAYSSSSQVSGLSAETKRKLKEAGIDPNTVSSEAEAKKKLQEAEEEKAKKNEQAQASQGSQQNSSQESLLSSVKALANKVGVGYTSEDSIDDILSAISDRLEQLIESVPEDSTQAQIYQMYQNEYQTLYNSYSQAQAGSAMLSSSLSALANYNKASL